MSLTFYPADGEISPAGPIDDRLDILTEAAEQFKAAVLDARDTSVSAPAANGYAKKRQIPREITFSYNWEEIARVLHELRSMPESSLAHKQRKADLITKLAEIYEVLRAAKMPKLEAVRIALVNEANQLRRGTSERVA